MNRARLLLAFLALAGGLSGCDHSSSHSGGQAAGRPYSSNEVRRAFAAAGIPLTRGDMSAAGVIPGLRVSFQGDDAVSVGIYERTAPDLSEAILARGQTGTVSQNLFVTYPKHSRLLPNIRRALAALRRESQQPSQR